MEFDPTMLTKGELLGRVVPEARTKAESRLISF
jgi:hypothetical protein